MTCAESHNEHDCYAVVVHAVKDGVVVRLYPRNAVSRIFAELHILSKGIILELRLQQLNEMFLRQFFLTFYVRVRCLLNILGKKVSMKLNFT